MACRGLLKVRTDLSHCTYKQALLEVLSHAAATDRCGACIHLQECSADVSGSAACMLAVILASTVIFSQIADNMLKPPAVRC